MTVAVNNPHPTEPASTELMDIELPTAPVVSGTEWELGVWLFGLCVLLLLLFLAGRSRSGAQWRFLSVGLYALLDIKGFEKLRFSMWSWQLQRLSTRLMKSEQVNTLQFVLSDYYVWIRQVEQACQSAKTSRCGELEDGIGVLKAQCEQALFSKAEVSRETLLSALKQAQQLMKRVG